jgi:hypothetical protein
MTSRSRRRLESAIYQATHHDYRARAGGRASILMLRRGATTLVPLETLSDAELHEAARQAGIDVTIAAGRRTEQGEVDDRLGEIGQGMTTTVRGVTVTRWAPNRFELDTLGRALEGHSLEEAARHARTRRKRAACAGTHRPSTGWAARAPAHT